MINSKVIAQVEERVGFCSYKTKASHLSESLALEFKAHPKDGSKCRIRGPGFKGMWEPGLVCGYMNSGGTLKALVVYTDRPRGDLFEFELVEAKRVFAFRVPKPKPGILDRYRKPSGLGR